MSEPGFKEPMGRPGSPLLSGLAVPESYRLASSCSHWLGSEGKILGCQRVCIVCGVSVVCI